MASVSPTKLEDLHAELLYLVTRYTCEPKGVLAAAVTDQLRQILRHPMMDAFPDFRQQCVLSLSIWCRKAGFLSMPAPAESTELH